MFRIGEFAQIAQVSTRQLRFYDQEGLLRPVKTDPQTGYRYYSARQLPRLNCILALKELGLSLEQIAPLLDGEMSAAELRGMLTMKRAQVERSLREEEVRLRHTESRIAGDRMLSVGGYLEGRLDLPFLAGTALTLADIAIVSNLINYQYLGYRRKAVRRTDGAEARLHRR